MEDKNYKIETICYLLGELDEIRSIVWRIEDDREYWELLNELEPYCEFRAMSYRLDKAIEQFEEMKAELGEEDGKIIIASRKCF